MAHRELASPPQHQGRVWTAEEMIARLTERHEMVARKAVVSFDSPRLPTTGRRATC